MVKGGGGVLYRKANSVTEKLERVFFWKFGPPFLVTAIIKIKLKKLKFVN